MFIIADVRHKFPSYFWKNLTGLTIITMDIKQTKVFNTFKEAKTFLDTEVIKTKMFKFSVCKIGIVQHWD